MNITKIETTDDIFEGSCLQGYVRTSYNNLKNIFGLPSDIISGDGKVNTEWSVNFTLDNGDEIKATIYDWKENSTPTDEYDWHVGGYNVDAVECVARVLEDQ